MDGAINCDSSQENSCSLTILISTERGRVATKRLTGKADGSIEKRSAAAIIWWQVRYAELADADDLLKLLRELASLPRCCVVRAKLVDGANSERTRKLLHDDGASPATFHEVPLEWVCFDFDDVEAPPLLDPLDPYEAGAHLRDLLPEAFRDAACVVQATSSCGLGDPGKLRYRLWFLLDRPLMGAEVEAWVGRVAGLDPATLRPSNLIYTATPIFDGVSDPVRERYVLLDGLEERVMVPDRLPVTVPSTQACDTGDDAAVRRGLRGTPEAVEWALAHIPNDDLPYDEWFRKACALKGALGEAGFVLFDRWSGASGKYDAKTTRRTWDSVREPRLGIGHLVGEAQRRGAVAPGEVIFDAERAAERADPDLHPAAPMLRGMEAAERLSRMADLGFEDWLKLIGDGERLLGFSEPVRRAIDALCRDETGLAMAHHRSRVIKTLIRQAIDTAPKWGGRGAELESLWPDARLDRLLAFAVERCAGEANR